MTSSKLPLGFGAAGLAIGFLIMGTYWLDYKFSLFHFQSTISNFFGKAMFVLCPGLLLQIFTIGTSDRLGWVMWLVAVTINWPLYYMMGLMLARLIERRDQRKRL